MNTEELYRLYTRNPAVSTDSRRVERGDMFFALKGENFDGNRFAAQAIERGAHRAVIDDPGAGKGEQYILVNNVLQSMQQLARFHREQLGIPVIAVTGSNGKTTTKELITACLSRRFSTTSTRGNLNNHIGVPISLLEITPGDEIAVMELGANHRGEIAGLCGIASPDYGLITNIGKAHLEGFGSGEGVRLAKGELYEYLGSRGKKIFVNGDDEMLVQMAAAVGTGLVLYGQGDESLVWGRILKADPLLSMELVYGEGSKGKAERMVVETRVFGTYNLANYLAAACIAEYFSVDRTAVREALEAYSPDNMRSQLVKSGSNLVVLDSYNANPASMRAAIRDFARMENEDKVLILGDMLELGEYSLREHAELLDFIQEHEFRAVYLTGSNFSCLEAGEPFRVFKTTRQLAAFLEEHPPRDSAILVKGSRLLALEEILPLLK